MGTNKAGRQTRLAGQARLIGLWWNRQGTLTGRLGMADLLIRVACFGKNVTHVFNIKNCQSKLVSTRRSIVLSLPLQKGFPGTDFQDRSVN
jgi:hypothetical protein